MTKPDTARAPGDAARPIVAVFNSSSDTVELLRTVLEANGLHTVPGHIGELKKGELDFVAFQPAQGCRFILTTTNKPALDKLVGETEALEIIGKPYDLDRVVAAVRAALGHAG